MPLVLLKKQKIEKIMPTDARLMTQMKLQQMKSQVASAADRMAPVAVQARDMAQDKLYVAREWAAPRLDAAAHSVEEQLAPRVSAMLSQAAAKVDPAPKGKSRSWPMFLLLAGLAVGAAGFAMYRRNSEQWTDMLKENASDASRWVSEKTHTGTQKAGEMAEKTASKTGPEADGRADKGEAQADQAPNKLS
ncbi:hypothetical protein [Streptosporangium sandarakinum]|uniref:hypothetical protein n=1 Tax=Streptosporangium sandarakinum TaxID=1260955 RepID=UPI00341C543E